LAVAASSAQEVGLALTLSGAKGGSEWGGMEGGQRVGMEGGKRGCNWAEEVANQSEDEMEGVAGSDRLTTPTPTPAHWGTPTPAPVTPTKGSNRMAVDTPRPPRRMARPAARPIPAGFVAASALEEILGAIGAREKRTAALEAAAKGRHEQVGLKLQEMETAPGEWEQELGRKLLVLSEIKTELAQKGPWEI
jgi:hypothetical protein